MSGIFIPGSDTLGVSNLGNTAGTSGVVSGPNIELLLAGGSNITLSQSVNGSSATITINSPAATQTLSAGTNSVTGTAVSLDLVGGTGIGLATATAAGALTVTISSTGSIVNSIGPSGSLSSGPITISGVNLTVSSNGAGVVQLSVAPDAAAPLQTISASGTSVTGSAVSLALFAGTGHSLATATAAGAMSVSILSSGSVVNSIGPTGSLSSGPITISGVNLTVSSNGAGVVQLSVAAPTQGSDTISASGTSVAGSAVSLALVAGTGISLGTATAAGAMTVSFSSTGSVVNSIGPTGSLSSGPITISGGSNITISSNGAGVISINAPASIANAVSIYSGNAGGSTSGILAAIQGTVLLAAGTGITLAQSTYAAGNSTLSSIITILGAIQSLSAAGTSFTSPNFSLDIEAGANITLQTGQAGNALTVSISGQSAGVTGTLSLVAGSNIFLSSSASAGTTSITINNVNLAAPKMSQTENFPQEGLAAVVSGSASAGTTMPFGSSLFLQRLFIPAQIVVTEVDLAHSISFGNASLSGVGAISQTLGVFSFQNSTLLASVFSASSSWGWTSGSSSAGLTGVQGGWTGPLIHSMGLSSGSAGTSTLLAGEYVIGNLMRVSQSATSAGSSAGGSLMSMTLFGGGPYLLSTASVHSGTTSTAATVFLSAPSNLAVTHWTAAPTVVSVGKAGTSWSTNTASLLSATATGASTQSILLSAGLLGQNILSTSGTAALGLLSTAGFTSASVAQSVAFSFQNTGSAFTTYQGFNFSAGVMSTGAIPAGITLTSNTAATSAITISGTALNQPWFALQGS